MTKCLCIVLTLLLFIAPLFSDEHDVSPVVSPSPNYVVVINDTLIPYDEYERAFEEAIQKMKYVHGIDIESSEGQALLAITRKSILEEFINYYLIQHGAEDMGVSITTKNIEKRLENLKAGYKNKAEFLADITAGGISISDLIKNIRKEMLIEKITQKLIETSAVSDDELGTLLENNPDLARDFSKRQVSQIIVSDVAIAREVVRRFKKGETFASLAKELSIDAETIETGGDLGYIDLNSLPVPSRKEVRRLKEKEISKVIEIDDEYYIYRVGEMLALDNQKRKALQDFLLNEKQEDIFGQWLIRQKNSSQITINPVLDPYYNESFDQTVFFIPSDNAAHVISDSYEVNPGKIRN
ncbi:MAG: SurA N-terminal domain-containing protein [Candidatus Margulisiibacteriota bacterium]